MIKKNLFVQKLQILMKVGSERKKEVVGQLLILAIILGFPVIFVLSYEMKWLDAIDVDQKILSNTIALEYKINQSLSQLKQQRLLKTAQVFPKNNIFSESQRSDFDRNVASRIQNNEWIGAFSSIRRLNIISIAIHADYQGNKVQLQKRIMRGLQWFNLAYQINLRIIKWNNLIRLDQVQENTVLVVFQEFRNELVEENIGTRLKKGEYCSEFYISQIVRQLRSTALFSHCKFTNQPCNQKTILIMPEYSYQGCSSNIENSFYIIDKLSKATIFELIANVFDLSELQRIKSKMQVDSQSVIQLYQLLKNISFYRQVQKILRYVNFIMNPITDSSQNISELINRSYDQLYQYLLHGKYMSPYIHKQEEKQIIQTFLSLVANNLAHGFDTFGKRLQMDPLTDSTVGKIDIFANNFKVGVYLPLFVLFFYPILIKFRDLVDYLFAKLRRKDKSPIEQKTKEE